MICNKCGTANREGEFICHTCGALLVAPAATKRMAMTSGLLVQNPVRQTTSRLKNVVVQIGDDVVDYPVRSGAEIVIGRGVEAGTGQVALDLTQNGGTENGVSRRHAIIRVEGFSAYLIDLSSTNGTFLNGRRIHPNHRHLLYSNDTVRFGALEVQVTLT